jgi:hypothetical protein
VASVLLPVLLPVARRRRQALAATEEPEEERVDR